MPLLQRNKECGWTRNAIPESGLAMYRDGNGVVKFESQDVESIVAHLIRFRDGGRVVTALITSRYPADLFVNGERPLGVCVLEDRSELSVSGELLYFTSFEALAVTRHKPSARSSSCARCTQVLCEGDEALRCSACGALHHEGKLAGTDRGERLCFSYDDSRCAGCGRHRSDLEWTPEEAIDA